MNLIEELSGSLSSFLMEKLDLKDMLKKNFKDLLNKDLVNNEKLLSDPLIPQDVLTLSDASSLLMQNSSNLNNQQSGSSNLMQNNFFNQNYQESQYVQATKNALITREKMKDSIQDTINGMLEAFDADPSVADPRMRRAKVMKKVVDGSEASFKEMQDSMEKGVEEAMAPKDANGNPIPSSPEVNNVVAEASGNSVAIESIPDSAPTPTVNVNVSLDIIV
ncbi:hypothetical protein [Desulfovibrio litoralis]|uniref:Uncharacterized protein n=1 Tax=Desulfovibrio litoralis DSM 11393 TaxID=1121455 RepID=A0A1M7SBW7_9BACT|nr:hypothetical protein [Desulfovibrio litoralis]SHN55955.1 hypothetical protein SAMN02745728_00736 [Desulfovibrio litoralis DSM 11393]